MGKINNFLESNNTKIALGINFGAFILSFISQDFFSIHFFNSVVYFLKCIQYELAVLLFLLLIKVIWPYLNSFLKKCNSFTILTISCMCLYTAIEAYPSVRSLILGRYYYFHEQLYKYEFQNFPLTVGMNAFERKNYMEAKIKFQEALQLLPDSKYSSDLEDNIEMIERNFSTAKELNNLYKDKPLSLDKYIALIYCKYLTNDQYYIDLVDNCKNEISIAIRDYGLFYNSCISDNRDSCNVYYQHYKWCYFEKDQIKELEHDDSLIYGKVKKIVLSESKERTKERLMNVWLLNRKDL